MPQKSKIKRAELHTHLGAAVHPSILWSIAHRQGIKLPSSDYWDFETMVTMTGKRKNKNLLDMHNNFYRWTELIQSSPEAIEESVKSVIGGGYRACNLTLQELRFNPMFRNRKGERDLDNIIMAALWGIQRAMMEYPQVKAGVILMMDRSHTIQQNQVIVKKAIKYRPQGIIGVDLAGPEQRGFSMKAHAPLFRQARKAGLGVTVHTGEAGSMKELKFVVNEIKPHRIGHGTMAVQDPKIMQAIVDNNITLEICPTSNLRNNVIKNIGQLKKIIQTLVKHNVKFTINTDGPEMYMTHIYKEQQLLVKSGILTHKQIDQCTKWAFEATFIK